MCLTALAILLAITVTTICQSCPLGVNCVSYSLWEGDSDARRTPDGETGRSGQSLLPS